ncbi:MAG: PolC-type DNA polymerase III, partial [Lachnospiraceae bacterium]|nr:PolC-type DNA polymerase III [Lachnospiraceae bacterium]
LVGSRGSVGSSFVATMAKITEVNPLPPHYRYPNCKHSDFDDPACKENALGAGCDMPDKVCPVCGTMMIKDGYDIPFETFLGFKGDKEPDIDLNFSGEYQSRAHAQTEVIFGEGQTFRAGTVTGLADKTAYGFVKKYFEEHGVEKRGCEIDRLSKGCEGIRRSTGQHPGGIIVLPYGEEINTFTPVQHPANDTETSIITTHFDYHKIEQNLLKLDILGHDDPTMIRKLEDLTGLDATKIPLDDPQVMSLFKGTEALGVTPEDLKGTPLGVLGVPEFGTDFAMQMLIDAGPQNFADLVRIAGLAHGTDVWLGNTKDLILGGLATLKTAICTRDDIMLYLISMGLEPSMAFDIMENVRKGKVAKGVCGKWDGWKQEMIDHGVPEWYIGSCEKIKYMFPKAHAAAYVMMAWRVAWFKLNRPLEYYTSFFTIRASAFNYETMCLGKENLEENLDRLRNSDAKLTAKDEVSIRDMRIVQEMYARGFEFAPLDIYRADATHFQIIDGKIMPSLTSIDGMGAAAAESLVNAAKDGEFLSRDDLRDRAKLSQTLVDKMAGLGLLGAIPESNQFSFFSSLGIM